jgi:hypothetical protein
MQVTVNFTAPVPVGLLHVRLNECTKSILLFIIVENGGVVPQVRAEDCEITVKQKSHRMPRQSATAPAGGTHLNRRRQTQTPTSLQPSTPCLDTVQNHF